MQSAMALVYPPQCPGCGEVVAEGGGLCPECWREMAFIRGSACCRCGAPLPGEAPGDESAECDDCMGAPRPWAAGRAVARYDGTARRMVMGLKHGDRQDLVPLMAGWMAAKVAPSADLAVVPVPIHWRRMLKRRFNQSALLAQAMARLLDAEYLPDALIRRRATPPQEGLGREERFRLQADTIALHPRRGGALAGRRVLLVDDVMTSGATLAAAAVAAGAASRLEVAVFARVVKD